MILGVIPARGGSKGIRRKNVKTLCGKPLLMWSIEAAHRSKLLDKFVVSTEDIEIANLALWAGAEVMIRPDELATDESTTLSVLQHVLKDWTRKNETINTVVLLQPTSPVRFNNIIDRAIKTYLNNVCDCLATGYWTSHGPWTNQHGPRQNQDAYFHDDGCVYIWDASVIERGLWRGELPYMMEIASAFNTEIDCEADFWRIEGIMKEFYE